MSFSLENHTGVTLRDAIPSDDGSNGAADGAVAADLADPSARRKALISRLDGLLVDFRRLILSPPPLPQSPVEAA